MQGESPSPQEAPSATREGRSMGHHHHQGIAGRAQSWRTRDLESYWRGWISKKPEEPQGPGTWGWKQNSEWRTFTGPKPSMVFHSRTQQFSTLCGSLCQHKSSTLFPSISREGNTAPASTGCETFSSPQEHDWHRTLYAVCHHCKWPF